MLFQTEAKALKNICRSHRKFFSHTMRSNAFHARWCSWKDAPYYAAKLHSLMSLLSISVCEVRESSCCVCLRFFVCRALVRRRRNAFNPVIIHLKNVVSWRCSWAALRECASIQFKSRAHSVRLHFCWCVQAAQQFNSPWVAARPAFHHKRALTQSPVSICTPSPYPASTQILMWLGKWKKPNWVVKRTSCVRKGCERRLLR